jgi:formylglycine-generating enzyme required for sulfatase activity
MSNVETSTGRLALKRARAFSRIGTAVCLSLIWLGMEGGARWICAGESWPATGVTATAEDEAVRTIRTFNFQSVRLAIADLSATFPEQYPGGQARLARLAELEKSTKARLANLHARGAAQQKQLVGLANELNAFRRDALLANPLLDFDRLLLVKHDESRFRLPRNDVCYSAIPQIGYDCEISILSPVSPEGTLSTFFKPDRGEYIADIDLHFDAERMLFTMPGTNRWQVFEIRADGTGLRQITSSPHDDVDSFDACYLPNGNIIYCSTANYQSVPCYNGTRRMGGLYLADADGNNVRQLTFDQDDNSYPTVANNGRVIFTRWEYAGIAHFFSRLIFQMNPDGSGQDELYGSNSYWPNAIYHARPIPGDSTRFIGIVSGHHGDRRMGELVLFDPAQGRHETAGVVQRIPGYGQPVKPIIRDALVDASWPKFMNPWPLSEKYFLVSSKPSRQANWGIYLADTFDNVTLIRELPGYVLLEPIPFRKWPRPPVIPDKVDLSRKDGLVYMVDVYEGGGLKGVPRGTVKSLRLISPHYGYFGNAGWLNIGIDGPWDVQRILGTVPVQEDGSAYFRVPANTPISVQPLDKDGKAVQLMRSWFTAMPGETKSCVGCHEGHSSVTPNVRTLAMSQPAREITPWHGPARGFSFERDVQPVLDANCISCHNGKPQRGGKTIADLRAREFFPDYQGVIAPVPRAMTNGIMPVTITVDDMGMEDGRQERRLERIKFTPAYEALHPYVRRTSAESDIHMLMPMEYHADTSELVQMLKKGHQGVQLDAESWDRLITWIDLNVPCHGTWSEVYPIPFNGRERRLEYLRLYGNIDEDYEMIPDLPKPNIRPGAPAEATRTQAAEIRPVVSSGTAGDGNTKAEIARAPGFPFDSQEARERQAVAASWNNVPLERRIELGSGVFLELVLIPAGEFVMGDAQGSADEKPLSRVAIAEPFWIGKLEIRNRDYALFDPAHDSGFISQMGTGVETRGYPVNEPDQPVVRVSWKQAMAFCDWLSERTGEKFSLPTEAQWEYACRAGTATPFWYGGIHRPCDKFANLADTTLEQLARQRGNLLHKYHPDWAPRDNHSRDGALVTTRVGSYLPNPWGLHDMHGNAAEWTRTTHRPYPYNPGDGRDAITDSGRKVVRGGSWYDRSKRSTSAHRWSYPAWQGVYNVGFRVVCEMETVKRASLDR